MRWKSSQPALAKQVAPDGARLMPAPPRWLLAVPDAVRQLEKLDRDLLTRRDVERLFGVSRARAAQLMRDVRGGARRGGARPPRTELLRQLRKYRARAAFRGEEQRRARLVAELRHGAAHRDPGRGAGRGARGAPRGAARGRDGRAGRIEVRFAGAKEAVVRLFALAQALTNDYERFETIVGKGERSG